MPRRGLSTAVSNGAWTGSPQALTGNLTGLGKTCPHTNAQQPQQPQQPPHSHTGVVANYNHAQVIWGPVDKW